MLILYFKHEKRSIQLEDKQIEATYTRYYSMIQCGVKYDSRAKPKYFMTFLKEVLYAENIRTAFEMIAYTFIRLHWFECYFILVSTGSNGKSVFVGVLCALHGKDNTANVSSEGTGRRQVCSCGPSWKECKCRY